MTENPFLSNLGNDCSVISTILSIFLIERKTLKIESGFGWIFNSKFLKNSSVWKEHNESLFFCKTGNQ